MVETKNYMRQAPGTFKIYCCGAKMVEKTRRMEDDEPTKYLFKCGTCGKVLMVQEGN